MTRKRIAPYIGIDVSKKVIDIAKRKTEDAWLHQSFDNTVSGHRSLVNLFGKRPHYVMEATGVYHLRLAMYLKKRGFKVSVLNPLIIRRFRQMRLGRVKTDKTDSKCIAEYAESQQPDFWKAPSPLLLKVRQEDTLLMMLETQQQQLFNHVEAITVYPVKSATALKLIKNQLNELQEKITCLKENIAGQMIHEFGTQMELICTIPGISTRTASVLLMVTGGLHKFDTPKQLCCFTGLTPMLRQSGTSLNAKGKISKMGSSRLRRNLYLCSWSAIRFNPQCKAMYDRMRLAGKPGKVILIAVMNKLLRQAFGVVKTGIGYSALTGMKE